MIALLALTIALLAAFALGLTIGLRAQSDAIAKAAAARLDRELGDAIAQVKAGRNAE